MLMSDIFNLLNIFPCECYIYHMSDSTVFACAEIIEKLNVKNLKMKRKA